MDIPLCHEPQIMIRNEAAVRLFEEEPGRFAGAAAESVSECARWAGILKGLPVGIILDCPERLPEQRCERPLTIQYIRRCKDAFRRFIDDCASFYYLRSAPDFEALRAAALAVSDLCGRNLIAEVQIEEEGLMPDGTEVCAAVGVLQRIGVTTVVLSAGSADVLSEALEITAPYARLSLGACIDSGWLHEQVPLYNTELIFPLGKEEEIAGALKGYGGSCVVERDHNGLILAPDGKHAHFIDPTIDISDEIECGHRLEEALIEAEDDAGALKLLLETEEDVIALEEHRYMISRPVCLCAESAELLEEGLRVYPGLALYDGTWEQPEDVVRYWEQKYGLIKL